MGGLGEILDGGGHGNLLTPQTIAIRLTKARWRCRGAASLPGLLRLGLLTRSAYVCYGNETAPIPRQRELFGDWRGACQSQLALKGAASSGPGPRARCGGPAAPPGRTAPRRPAGIRGPSWRG